MVVVERHGGGGGMGRVLVDIAEWRCDMALWRCGGFISCGDCVLTRHSSGKGRW